MVNAMLRCLFENRVRSSCFEIAFRNPLRQVADDAKDLLVMIPKSRLGVGVRAGETSNVAVMALVRWISEGADSMFV